MAEKNRKKLKFAVKKFKNLPSTNDYLEQNREKIVSDTVVIAKTQTFGHGTKERIFVSPKGGLYISFLFKTPQNTSLLAMLTPCIAVLTRRAIKKATGIEVGIKWVNDLYLNGKKLCGILCKTFVLPDGENAEYLVGIGINVNTLSFPSELENIATSLKKEVKKSVNISKIAKFLIDEMKNLPNELEDKSFVKEYSANSVIIGKNASFNGKNVTVKSINENCSCTVVDENNNEITLRTGEIIITE